MSSNRQPIDQQTLEQLTADILAEWSKAGQEFTAYGMALEMRKRRPDLEILHGADTRAAFQNWMSNAIANGLDYTNEVRTFGQADAMVWMPRPAQPPPQPQTLAQKVAAKIGALIPW